MQTLLKMRDRRNTSLSISSNSSTTTPSDSSSRSSLNEKRHSSPPPPSSILPAPVTKENCSVPNARPRLRMAYRILALACTLLALWHFLLRPIAPLRFSVPTSTAINEDKIQPDAAGESELLPAEPSAVVVTDKAGYSRWTVSIPPTSQFPLQSKQYSDICSSGDSLRERLALESRLVRAKDWRRNRGYYSQDHTFIDVDEAERTGALTSQAAGQDENVCERSLTVALDSSDASFGKSLLMLWLSYGLAKKEGRAFFIDDTRWAYGKYSSFFLPPPAPECAQPPPHHIVPCPHSARHLLVSSATAPWTFGSAFEKEFSQSRKYGIEQSHRIYDLLRSGYKDLFVMQGEDALYASSRLAKFKEDAHQYAGSVVGMHIRRGDLHPHEYQYSQDYLPLERYASAARRMLRDQLHATLPDTHKGEDDFHKFLEYVHSPLLLGSDDPEMFDSAELKEAAAPFIVQKAQERIQLATKATLDMTSPAESLREPGSAYVKHIDENAGWEGGFYSSLFFAIGKSKRSTENTDLQRTMDQQPSEGIMRMRELVGRAYLLDLAVLGESDGVVCAVSSASCRVLGVMLGWDAVKSGRWMNVDDNRPWSWNGQQ